MQERLEPERIPVEESIATPDAGDENRQAALLGAAADPIRLRILALIRRPLAVTEICRALGLAQPRVSHHLAVLREAGLVSVKPRGRRRVYGWAVAPSSRVRDLQALLGRWLAPRDRGAERREGGETGPAGSSHAPSRGGDMDDYLL